jgi:hypothetical protein
VVERGNVDGGQRGEVAQTMCTHINEYKNNKKRKKIAILPKASYMFNTKSP